MNRFKPLELKKSGFTSETIQQIQTCLRDYPKIEQAILHGSRAKGNHRLGSDIDICLVGKGLDSSTALNLDNSLDELMLPYTFDISIYDQIDDPQFKDHIDRIGVILYQR